MYVCMYVCLSVFPTLRKPNFERVGIRARRWFDSTVMRYKFFSIMYVSEFAVRTVRRYMLGASTVSKSTARGVLFRARQHRRETTFDETYILQTSLEKFGFRNCCVFRSDEREATFRNYVVLWANTAVTTRYVEVVIIIKNNIIIIEY